VRVKVVRVNLEQSKIDFVPVAPPVAPLQAAPPKKLRDQDKRMQKVETRYTDGKRSKKR
jgi:hypothetical protein